MKIWEIIKLLIAYPGKIFKWIIDGRFHNLTFIILAVTILYFLKTITYQPKIVSALFLVSGLSIIIWQMIGDSKRFSKHSPNTFKHWIKRIPRFTPKPLIIKTGVAESVGVAEKVRVKISIPESSSIEEKVNFLMRRREEMAEALDNLNDKIDDKSAKMNKKIKVVNDTIEETKKIINSTISDITVGNYDLRFLSIVLMMCGTFLQILI